MARNEEVAVRKRQQIDSSKKTMFISIAVVAFIAGISIVVGVFLVKQIIFHARIIAFKQGTISTINRNIEAVDELKDNVRVLATDSGLNSVKIKEDSSALQSILDALPAEPNADALGASLQNRFVDEVDGLSIDNLVVNPVGSEEEYAVETETVSEESLGTAISFQMVVSGSADSLKELLTRFERSIRVIELDLVEVQASERHLTMSIIGRAYYEPARVIELGTKVIKP